MIDDLIENTKINLQKYKIKHLKILNIKKIVCFSENE